LLKKENYKSRFVFTSPWLLRILVRSILNCIASSEEVGVAGRDVKVIVGATAVKRLGLEGELITVFV
jgi:hypothetical protein